jgi:hypothetical protein
MGTCDHDFQLVLSCNRHGRFTGRAAVTHMANCDATYVQVQQCKKCHTIR